MRWNIHRIGKPSLAYAKSGIDEYLKRLRRYTPVEFRTIKEGGKEANSAQFLKNTEGTLRIALDERGKDLTTDEWVSKIESWELHGQKQVSLLIGGADGHTGELRKQCDEVWRLSSLTLQHELALVVLLEGLYRCYTIRKGEPYHR